MEINPCVELSRHVLPFTMMNIHKVDVVAGHSTCKVVDKIPLRHSLMAFVKLDGNPTSWQVLAAVWEFLVVTPLCRTAGPFIYLLANRRPCKTASE